jgi:hypothetical protein
VNAKCVYLLNINPAPLTQKETEQAAAFAAIRTKAQEDLLRIKEKSEDDYEKNIIYIAAGTLVLSLTFLEKIVNLSESSAVWFLIWSWILLSITLLGNLVSHQLAAYYHEKYRLLYAECVDDMSLPDLKLKKYNGIMLKLNWSTTITLFFGIAMLVTFCSINAYHKTNPKIDNNKKMSKEIKPQTNQPDTQKGRTISQPVTRPVQQPAAQPAPPPAKKN